MPFPTAILRRGAALALCFALPFCTPARGADQDAAAAPALSSFFDNSSFGGALLSPSGRYLAARTSGAGQRLMLAVIDLQDNKLKVVAAYSDADIGQMVWVNDERLAFDVTDRATAPGEDYLGAGLYAVNRDGSGLRQLATRRGQAFMSEDPGRARRPLLPWHTFLMDDTGAQDTEFLYVTSPKFDNRDGCAPSTCCAWTR
jgi:hypothetical protein